MIQVEHTPGLTVALALVAGLVAQVLARWMRVPAIVLLLGMGVLLGPDVANVVRPTILGDALHSIVGFGVAVILFEGAMNLNVRRLRREALLVRRLVTVGVLVTATCGALAARLLMGWEWRLAVVFGALVSVTGPTVITPLLRRIKVRHNVETILEAEGIFADAVGAILAVVAVELPVGPAARTVGDILTGLGVRLGVGVAFGIAGGAFIVLQRRYGRVPEDLQNVLTLTLVLALYQGAEALVDESGIAAAAVAGVLVGNAEGGGLTALARFKGQLTVLLLSLLFVLLAADVRLATVTALGLHGLAVVALLMFVVRPLDVTVSTFGSQLAWRERAFLAWLAPRGIVAAAVASLFARQLGGEGEVETAHELEALVFLVIATTVTVQGLTARTMARLLGVERAVPHGWAILGANILARRLARVLARSKEDVILIDANPDACRAAQEEGLHVIYGNGIVLRTLLRARVGDRRACLGLTANSEVNYLFAKTIRDEFPEVPVAAAVAPDAVGASPALLREAGCRILFGAAYHLDRWTQWLELDAVVDERWLWRGGAEKTPSAEGEPAPARRGLTDVPEQLVLPLALERLEQPMPVHDGVTLRPGDIVTVLVHAERAGEAREWLRSREWESLPRPGGTSDAPMPPDGTMPSGGEAP